MVLVDKRGRGHIILFEDPICREFRGTFTNKKEGIRHMALYTMKELLQDARNKHYGIGYLNAVNMEMTRAYIRAAEEAHSPIIIGTAEGLLGYADFEWITPMLLDQARRAKVPVAVHLDHTYHFGTLMQALRLGFGSVMYDGTRGDRQSNIAMSREIAKIAHPMGVGLECELGIVAGLSDEGGHTDQMVYTNPGEAKEFVEQTGADFLAISIGTVHGVYQATPKLDIPRLEQINAAVDVPLVLHGGSGLSDDDFRNTIRGGISKVNVYTDIIIAARQAVLDHSDKNYTDIAQCAEEAMKQATLIKLQLFGSAGMA